MRTPLYRLFCLLAQLTLAAVDAAKNEADKNSKQRLADLVAWRAQSFWEAEVGCCSGAVEGGGDACGCEVVAFSPRCVAPSTPPCAPCRLIRTSSTA